MYVYVDETGNTGDNIFDEQQPFFVTAALITKTNFDVLRRNAVTEVAKSLGVSSLHAAELGIGRLNSVAEKILTVLKACDARIFVSRVEKRYLAATKIIDTVFDSFENKAVPWHVYNLKHLKLIILFKLAYYVFDNELARRYWECLMCRNEARAYELFADACHDTIPRLEALPDARSRQIAASAFAWAAENPREISVYSATKESRYGHLPNVVGFINLMDGVERQSEIWKKRVNTITHDRQSQFEKTLAYWHEMLSNADPTPIHWPGLPAHKLQRVFGSKFVVSSGNESPGIQLIDVIMWLFQRMNRGDEIGFECSRLMDHILSKGYHSDFSFDGVYKHLSDEMRPIMEADMSEEQLDRGREMVKMFDERKDFPDLHQVAAGRIFHSD